MDLTKLLSKLRWLVASRVLYRVLVLLLAIFAVSLVNYIAIDDIITEIFSESSHECERKFFPGQFLEPFTFYPFQLPETSQLSLPSSSVCEKSTENLTSTIFRELMDTKLLNSRARVLCVGRGSASAVSVLQNLGFQHSLPRRKGFNSRPKIYEKKTFDLVYYKSYVDKLVVPPLVVFEMERVLRPGGLGAMLLLRASSNATKLAASSSVSANGPPVTNGSGGISKQ